MTSWICSSVSFLSLRWNILEDAIVRTQQHNDAENVLPLIGFFGKSHSLAIVSCVSYPPSPTASAPSLTTAILMELPSNYQWTKSFSINRKEKEKKKYTFRDWKHLWRWGLCRHLAFCLQRFRINTGGTLVRLQSTGKRLCSLMSSFSHALRTVPVSLVSPPSQ